VENIAGAVETRAAASASTRIESENILIAHAKKNPLLGYSRSGALPRDEHGRAAAKPDGLWVVTLCRGGLVGLAALMSLLLLPPLRAITSLPTRLWRGSALGPVALLSVVVVIFMLDCLSNAMINPLYVLAGGGLIGFSQADANARRGIQAMHRRGLGTRPRFSTAGNG
jgi:O-antigen ligase